MSVKKTGFDQSSLFRNLTKTPSQLKNPEQNKSANNKSQDSFVSASSETQLGSTLVANVLVLPGEGSVIMKPEKAKKALKEHLTTLKNNGFPLSAMFAEQYAFGDGETQPITDQSLLEDKYGQLISPLREAFHQNTERFFQMTLAKPEHRQDIKNLKPGEELVIEDYWDTQVKLGVLEPWKGRDDFFYTDQFYAFGNAIVTSAAKIHITKDEDGKTQVRVETEHVLFDRYDWSKRRDLYGTFKINDDRVTVMDSAMEQMNGVPFNSGARWTETKNFVVGNRVPTNSRDIQNAQKAAKAAGLKDKELTLDTNGPAVADRIDELIKRDGI